MLSSEGVAMHEVMNLRGLLTADSVDSGVPRGELAGFSHAKRLDVGRT